jgi:hypothetical protein
MIQELHTVDYLLLPASGGGHTDEVLSRETSFDNDDEGYSTSLSKRQNVWEDEEEEESF